MAITSLTGLGTSVSPNFSSIIFGLEQINQYGTNHNDLVNLFANTKSISGAWTFATLPTFGTLTGVIKGATGVLTGSATLTDLGSPTSAFNFGNQELRNLNKLILGANTTSSNQLDIKNVSTISSLFGAGYGGVNLEGPYTADYYNCIDFRNTGELPCARIAVQTKSTGSFFAFGTSTDYTVTGITHNPILIGYFTSEADSGIKVGNSIFFGTNNLGSIGTSSVAVANIYSVNALNVTSDNDEKKDINKNIPLGLDFVKLVANTAIATYSWKDTITPEKIEKHSRTRFGFLGVELYNAIIASGLDTKRCAFLSVYDEDQIYNDEKNAITGEIKENKKKKPFEVKLTKEGRPKGKITIQPTEMLPILFKAILEQNQQIEELQAQVKLLLEK